MPLNFARLRALIPAVVALLCLLFGSPARADFHWYIDSTTYFGSSPAAACVAIAPHAGAWPTSEYRYDSYYITRITETQFDCYLRFRSPDGQEVVTRYNPIHVIRGPGSCDLPKVYDDQTGECNDPPKDCKSETGDILTRGSIAGIVVTNGRTYSLSQAPSSACVDSCTFALKDEGRPRYTSCYLVKGSQVDSFCNYILTGTGEPCSGWNWAQPETGDPLNPADTPDAPPSDPNDPGCPKGWSWSGTTCVKTPTDGDGGGDKEGDKDKDPSGGGGVGGGGGDKDPGGDGQDGGTDGDKDKDKDPGSGTGGGKDPDKGSSLKPPKAGSFDNANKEWEAKAEQARQLFNEKLKQQMNSFKGVFDVNLGQGAGSLPCERFTVLGQTLSICLTDYATELAYLRQILLLVASVIAATIVLRD